jgi:two-component system, OmpR family, response regulator RpaB
LKSHQQKILVVDDEASLRRILETRFSIVGYDVVTAADGEEALDIFHNAHPDLVVLDVIMPKLDGYEVLKELRSISDVPIIMVTARGDAADRNQGLELGASDYVVKPFSPKELSARITRMLRPKNSLGVIFVGSIKIDIEERQVYKADERIQLTGTEFRYLEVLVSRAGEPLSREEILKSVWGYTPDYKLNIESVDFHISQLQAKLEDTPSNPLLIVPTSDSNSSGKDLKWLFDRSKISKESAIAKISERN